MLFMMICHTFIQKMVVKMDVYDNKSKKRVIETVAKCPGITTITMDTKEGKLTVIGDLNIMEILSKLERRWRNLEMLTFGPYNNNNYYYYYYPNKESREHTEAINNYMPSSYTMQHYNVVCDNDFYNGCVIS
ncbi:unnamed protein product [Cochlearia groenlandica]